MSTNQEADPQAQDSSTEPQHVPETLPLDLRVATLTDTGRSRPHNEDYVDCYVPTDSEQLERKGALYLAADGMGGHQAGEVASQGAVELTIGHYYSDTNHEPGTSLVRAVRAANKVIHEQAQADPTKAGMGTTLVGAVLLGRHVYIANVGDSRAYLINQRGIARITEDHSWVEEQIKAGMLTPEEARRHPQRNVVTRALGTKPSVEVDLFEGEMNEGDILLLCSDGLTGHLEDQEIAAIALRHPPEDAVRSLIAQANERGGHDNISVVLVSARKDQPQEADTVAPATVVRKPERKFPIIPALAGLVIVMIIALAALLILPPLIRGTPTPTEVPSLATLTPTTEVAATEAVRPSAEPTQAPTETAVPTVEVIEETPTATLVPTDTPEPTETPKVRPTKAQAAQTTEPTAEPSPTPFPAPDLLEPAAEEELSGMALFNWEWNQAPLSDNAYFDLRIWSEWEHDQPKETRKGATELSKRTEAEVELDSVPAILADGPGIYYWSVVVVEKPCPSCSPELVGEWGEERSFLWSVGP